MIRDEEISSAFQQEILLKCFQDFLYEDDMSPVLPKFY